MAPSLLDSHLPASGSLVGPWIVGKAIGSGSYGTVFRAVHKDRPEAGSYALKVAHRAGDERFEREAWLLARVHHPSVPRLEGNGTWRGLDGEAYPYVVMQWVEGINLYAWALEHGLTLRRAISQLAQVARALQAVHPHGVHRDVKGGNVRVSDEGRAVLLDFGSCWYRQASPLTNGHELPGTRRYHSPQMQMFKFAVELGHRGYYEPQPADDLYALGVTAYRLLAGDYPPSDPGVADGSQKVVQLQAPRELKEACPELGRLLERLLSEDDKERGSAQAVAEELESLLEYSNSALDEPWKTDASRQPTENAAPPVPPKRVRPPVLREPPPPSVPGEQAPAPVPREQALPPAPREQAQPPAPSEHLWRALVAGVAVAGGSLTLMLLCVLLTRNGDSGEEASMEQESESKAPENPDAGTSLGDESFASALPAEKPPISEGRISREIPDDPIPGQKLPPCNHRAARIIKGGCWLLIGGGERAPCESVDYGHDGRCYTPLLVNAPRVPTSTEPH